jgi:hypothetical protein
LGGVSFVVRQFFFEISRTPARKETVNYSATWKAQEKQKTGETDVEIPVSDIY